LTGDGGFSTGDGCFTIGAGDVATEVASLSLNIVLEADLTGFRVTIGAGVGDVGGIGSKVGAVSVLFFFNTLR